MRAEFSIATSEDHIMGPSTGLTFTWGVNLTISTDVE
jgi:hypothetical protein